jgi:hypothetical protein
MAAVTVKSTAVISGICPDFTIPAGVVLSRTGTYTASAGLDGALDANSVIQLIPMPIGAQLLDLMVAWTALGASRTIDVGICDTGYTGYDIDMFIDGVAAQYAGYARWGATMINNAADDLVHGAKKLADTWPYEFTANGAIDAKIIGGTFPLAATITAVAIYKMEGGIADET